MNLAALRALFPVTGNAAFLNNAAESPLSLRVRQRLEEYLILASDAPQDKPSVRHKVRRALQELFGGSPDEYALVTSTGVGIGLVAAGFPWQAGENMVVPADEHWNNTFPWLALRQRGVDVRLAPVGADQRIDPNAIAALVDEKTRILATTAVRFNTGFRADLKRLGTLAHEHGALFVVDGIQSAGVTPLHVEEDGIDVLSCAGFKWLLGMPGTGFLYVAKDVQEKITPVLPGMFAAEENTRELRYFPDARRFETGTIAYSLFYAWIAGLELLKEVGIHAIHARVLELTDTLIAGLRARDIAIASPVEKMGERSAIISFTLGSTQANQELYQRLLERKIIVAIRDGRIRASPNFFNTENEIAQLLDAM